MKLVKLEIKERKRDECTENERGENEVYCTRSNQGLSRMGRTVFKCRLHHASAEIYPLNLS